MQPSEGSSLFLRSVREAIGMSHFSIRTEEAYLIESSVLSCFIGSETNVRATGSQRVI